MSRITINGITIDPQAQEPMLAAAGLDPAGAIRSDYILVQAREPLTDAQKAQLTQLGVRIQEYVPEDTYLSRFTGDDLGPVRALPFVAWAGVYFEDFKIPPSLRPAQADDPAALVPMRTRRAPSRKRTTVDIVLHEGVDPEGKRVQDALAAAAKVDRSSLKASARKVRVTVEEGQLDDLAAVDAVRTIEPVPQRQLFNNKAREILQADVLVNNTRFQGEGQIVAVADTGFDKGSTHDVHPAFTGRVKKLYALGRPRGDDPDGHGTHVAGSVLGDGTSLTMGGEIKGTAPKATLILQSTLDADNQLGGFPNDLRDLFEPPYSDGARVHTNSWGATDPGRPYDASATEIDDFIWHHPDLVVCFAAGNDGTDANRNGVVDQGSVGSQSAAKNCITVGASENERPEVELTYSRLGYPVDPIRSDAVADDRDGMSAFSSRGPTRENRLKPDVVAPGTSILSTLSRRVASPSTLFGRSSDPLYFFEGGTSMATPLVAGCAAVLRETLIRNGTPEPTAALVKALLINGAVELAGQYVPSESGPTPNNNSGFGRVNLSNSVLVAGADQDSGFGEGEPLGQGEEATFTIDVPGGPPHRAGEPAPTTPGVTLKVTLVWTDPAGAALQNDLDLVVVADDGQERHGNMGTSDRFDRVNNVEQVEWTNIPPGKVTVAVRAFRTTQFAQPYAFAWRVS